MPISQVAVWDAAVGVRPTSCWSSAYPNGTNSEGAKSYFPSGVWIKLVSDFHIPIRPRLSGVGSASAMQRNDAQPYRRYGRLILHEENWLPLVRSLGTFTAVTNAIGDRRAPAVH